MVMASTKRPGSPLPDLASKRSRADETGALAAPSEHPFGSLQWCHDLLSSDTHHIEFQVRMARAREDRYAGGAPDVSSCAACKGREQDRDAKIMTCGHKYHWTCLLKWAISIKIPGMSTICLIDTCNHDLQSVLDGLYDVVVLEGHSVVSTNAVRDQLQLPLLPAVPSPATTNLDASASQNLDPVPITPTTVSDPAAFPALAGALTPDPPQGNSDEANHDLSSESGIYAYFKDSDMPKDEVKSGVELLVEFDQTFGLEPDDVLGWMYQADIRKALESVSQVMDLVKNHFTLDNIVEQLQELRRSWTSIAGAIEDYMRTAKTGPTNQDWRTHTDLLQAFILGEIANKTDPLSRFRRLEAVMTTHGNIEARQESTAAANEVGDADEILLNEEADVNPTVLNTSKESRTQSGRALMQIKDVFGEGVLILFPSTITESSLNDWRAEIAPMLAHCLNLGTLGKQLRSLARFVSRGRQQTIMSNPENAFDVSNAINDIDEILFHIAATVRPMDPTFRKKDLRATVSSGVVELPDSMQEKMGNDLTMRAILSLEQGGYIEPVIVDMVLRSSDKELFETHDTVTTSRGENGVYKFDRRLPSPDAEKLVIFPVFHSTGAGVGHGEWFLVVLSEENAETITLVDANKKKKLCRHLLCQIRKELDQHYPTTSTNREVEYLASVVEGDKQDGGIYVVQNALSHMGQEWGIPKVLPVGRVKPHKIRLCWWQTVLEEMKETFYYRHIGEEFEMGSRGSLRTIFESVQNSDDSMAWHDVSRATIRQND